MEVLAGIGEWAGYLLWSMLLVLASLFVYLGLGGNFIILALALIYAVITGFAPIGWGLLAVLAGIATLAELIEFALGTFFAAGKGATRSGIIGAFVGGLVGASAGNSLVPVIGAVLGAFAGAFLGAVAGEYRHQQRLEPSLRIGAWSFVGRLLAILIKHFCGIIMVFLILRRTVPSG